MIYVIIMCQKRSNISYNYMYTVFRFYAGFTEFSFSTKVLIYIAFPLERSNGTYVDQNILSRDNLACI